MRKVIMGIGIPGSGKTTVLQQLAQEHDYTYICPDDIREELTGNATDQSQNKEVWRLAYQRAQEALAQNHSVVFDATFAQHDQRKEFLDFARNAGAEKIQGIFIDTPIEIAKERNRDRDRSISEHVIDRMDANLRSFPPEVTEGFDSIFTLDEYQKIRSVEKAEEGLARRALR
jgi:predicted kinase